MDGLHCSTNGFTIWRHNTLRNVFVDIARSSGINTKIEQKYNNDKINEIDKENKNKHGIVIGIPGDLKLINFNINGKKSRDLYCDVVVSNIFAKTWLPLAKTKALALATRKEHDKKKKYDFPEDFQPLSIECMGGMGMETKALLQKFATRLSSRKNIPYPMMINRLRSRIVSKLIQCNTRMILNSITL